MMAALLAVVGVQAQTRTVRKYLRLSDSNFYPNFSGGGTKDLPNNTINFTADNQCAAWAWESGINLSSYTSLVVRFAESIPADKRSVIIQLNDKSAGFWGNRECLSFTEIASQTDGTTITLSSLTHNCTEQNNVGDGETLDLTTIKQIGIWNNNHTSWQSIPIAEVYLEKVVDDATYKDYTAEYFDITNYTYGGLTSDYGYVTTTDAKPSIGWDFNGGLDMSGYRYLVIVPKRQWANSAGVPNAQINMCNYSGGSIGDAITDIKWISDYNPRRAVVLDLQSDSKDEQFAKVTPESLGRLYVTTPWGKGDFGLSAVYLTNTMPTWSSEAYNNTDATTRADYYRLATTSGTWGTVCLPYNAAVCGADIFEVVGVDRKDSPSKLYLDQVDGIMTAGKAYLYKTNSNQTHRVEAATYYQEGDAEVTAGTKNAGDLKTAAIDEYYETGNVTFYRAGEYETNTPTGTNLIGTFTGATVPDDGYSYILSSAGTWKKVGSVSKNVGANRAYLTLDESLVVPPSAARERGYIAMQLDGGQSSAISEVSTDDAAWLANKPIYNLSGQRIKSLQRGLNIVGGKKVYVK